MVTNIIHNNLQLNFFEPYKMELQCLQFEPYKAYIIKALHQKSL